MRRITASCWKSFSPNTATCGFAASEELRDDASRRRGNGPAATRRTAASRARSTSTQVWRRGVQLGGAGREDGVDAGARDSREVRRRACAGSAPRSSGARTASGSRRSRPRRGRRAARASRTSDEVARVQRAHRRDERDAPARRALPRPQSELPHAVDDLHDSRSLSVTPIRARLRRTRLRCVLFAGELPLAHVVGEARARPARDRRAERRRTASRSSASSRERPSRSCITSTWPSQSTPAPMPIVGIASSRGDLARELRRHALEHDREGARVLDRVRVGEHALARRPRCGPARGSRPSGGPTAA